MDHILRKFPNQPPGPKIVRADGIYLYTGDGRKMLDANAGGSSFAVLGFSHPQVLAAMREQMDRFCHIDYNAWSNPQVDELAELIISRAPRGLGRVYFAGNGGSEAVEAAMKLSYQSHHDAGHRKRTWFISRRQSYHGSTLHGLTVSELENLGFYRPILPSDHAWIAPHYPLYFRLPNESLDDYARRSAGELEQKIIEIGPDKVCAFVGETMLGAVVGDVPPAPGYWKLIRQVCDRHGVHLILDEVYCGMGRSGKVYCCEWDGVSPDFIAIGKTLASGYAPLSAVITSDEIAKTIASGPQGRIQHGHTHQGHALGVAASLAVQRMVHDEAMLDHIGAVGKHMRQKLRHGLGEHPYFRDLRGRGTLFSLEYDCPRRGEFGLALGRIMNEEYNILVNAKWHRISFSPPYITTLEEADIIVEATIKTFLKLADTWSD